MKQYLSKIIHVILDLLIPKRCLGCGGWSLEILCKHCHESYDYRPQYTTNFCNKDIGHYAMFEYCDPLKSLLHHLKFLGHLSCVPIFVDMINRWCEKNQLTPFDYVIYMPVHQDRLKQRGFNQVNLLFEPIMTQLGIATFSGVVRTKNTPPLYLLDINQRADALKDAFTFHSTDAFRTLQNKRVIIVDDIMTTGTSMQAMCTLLKEAKVKKLLMFSLFYVLDQRDPL